MGTPCLPVWAPRGVHGATGSSIQLTCRPAVSTYHCRHVNTYHGYQLNAIVGLKGLEMYKNMLATGFWVGLFIVFL